MGHATTGMVGLIETLLQEREIPKEQSGWADMLWDLCMHHREDERVPGDGSRIPFDRADKAIKWLKGFSLTAEAEAKRAATRPSASQPGERRTYPPMPRVPEGFYALPVPGGGDSEHDVTFYKIDCPTEGQWAGKIFVKIEVGGPRYLRMTMGEQRRALEEIIAYGEAKSMQLYGQASDRCCYCHRPLSRRTPRYNGRGNDCAKDRGLTQVKPPASWRPDIQDAA